MSVFRLTLLLLAVAVTAGCGSRPSTDPKTYPARGKVVSTNGQPAFVGGLVEFRSTTQPHNASGLIGADGSFTLGTVGDRDRLPGAVEGTFQVTLLPKLGDQTAGPAGQQPYTLPQPVTVKPDAGNDFTLTVPGPRR